MNNPQYKISSGSNLLLVASIPGRVNLQVVQQPKKQLQIQWIAPESSQELVFYHKSHCTNNGVCPVTVFILFFLTHFLCFDLEFT